MLLLRAWVRVQKFVARFVFCKASTGTVFTDFSPFDLGEEGWLGSQTRLLRALSRQIKTETAETLWSAHFTLLTARTVPPNSWCELTLFNFVPIVSLFQHYHCTMFQTLGNLASGIDELLKTSSSPY